MTSLGVISEPELDFVSCVLHMMSPDEMRDQGITVSVVDGLRVWAFGNNFGQIEVIGAPADFAGKYNISPRFLYEANNMAAMDDECEFIIDGEMVRAVSTSGSIEMRQATIWSVLPDTDFETITTATLSQTGLHHLVFFGTTDPATYINSEFRERMTRATTVVIGNNSLGLRTSFLECGGHSSFRQQSAEVTGPAGEVSVDRNILRRMCPVLERAGNLPMTVSFDVANGSSVVFSGANFRIVLPLIEIGAARYHDEVIGRLGEATIEYTIADDGRVRARLGGQVIELALLDGRTPVLRCSVELVSGIERTPDLLIEIDQQNQGRVFTKYFTSENSVWATSDIRCDALESMIEQLHGLVADSELLGVYLASLGICGDDLTLSY